MPTIRREIEIFDNVSSIRILFETGYDIKNTVYSDSLHIYLCKEDDNEIKSVETDKNYLIFTCDRQTNKIYGNGIKIEKIVEDDEYEIIEVEIESPIEHGNKSYFFKETKGSFNRIMDFFMEKR